jgi:hypothetical protein
MKTTEPFRIQFGGFLLRLCFPDFLAIFFADFPSNLHTSAFIGTLFDSPGKFSIFSTKLDFSRNSATYQAEEAEVEGSEKFDISRGDETVQVAGKGNLEENTQRQKENGERSGIQ